MTQRLAISDIVKFQIKLSINDAGVKKDFPVWLIANRISVDDMQAKIDQDGDLKVHEFNRKVCLDNITDWQDQRLVLNDDNTPAPFSRDGLALMLSVPGAVGITHSAYLEAVTASSGPVGRLKNS